MYVFKTPQKQRALAPCRAHKRGNSPRSHIQDAVVFPRGFTVSPPFCFDTPLWCLHAFNQPRDSQECIVGCIYTAVAPLSTHIRLHSAPGGGEVPQEGKKRKTRSRTEITSFKPGVKVGSGVHSLSRKTLSGLTEAAEKLTLSGKVDLCKDHRDVIIQSRLSQHTYLQSQQSHILNLRALNEILSLHKKVQLQH